MSAFMSGEMKDTVQMNPAGEYGMCFLRRDIHYSTHPHLCEVLDRFFSKQERRRLFRSWAGSASMWIKVLHSLYTYAMNIPDWLFSGRRCHLGQWHTCAR